MTLLELYNACGDLTLKSKASVSIDFGNVMAENLEWFIYRFGNYQVQYFEIETAYIILKGRY